MASGRDRSTPKSVGNESASPKPSKKDTPPSRSSQDVVNCPLCRRTLNGPKMLPCQHTFCMTCLKTHIMTSDREDDAAFKCPVCGNRILAPQKDLKVDQWAKNFKSSHLVSSAVNAFELKKGERKCDPCQSNRKRAAAITWCTSCHEALCVACTSSHKGMKLTRSHVLLEISKLKSQQITSILRDEKCAEHEDQFLQFFCKDHKQQCCPTCAVIVHRKCDNVLEMKKLGKEIKDQQKAERLLKRLAACLETQKTALSGKCTAKDTMVSNKQSILSEIRDMKMKLIELLDDMETAFIKEFDALHLGHEIELQTEIEEAQRLIAATENTIALMETAMSHGSENQIFLTFERAQDDCRKYEKLLIECRKDVEEMTYSFKMDERLKQVANSVRKFGHLSVESDNATVKKLRECSVRETAVFGARTPFDDLRGVDVFPNGDIIISDRISKSALLFHSNGEFASHLNFQSRPWGVAVLGVRTACVSFPETQEIHIVKSSYRRLEDYKTINTGISCFAISNFSGEYLTIQHKEDKEEKGRVAIAQSDKQITHKSVIDITANHEHVQGITYDEATAKLYVATDFDAIECYSVRGRLLFRNSYTGYGDFRGMCVDRESNVYVASHAGKGILQLTSDGERVRMIPTAPLAPLDVAVTPRGKMMVAVGRSDMVYIYSFR